MHWTQCLCVSALIAAGSALPPAQIPLSSEGNPGHDVSEHIEKKRELQGRFLHITDFHPDRFYKVYTSTSEDSACHRGTGPAGLYGAETSECDSPIDLVNSTFAWLDENLKDKIDFVIWTGDSARHDNDEEIPRNAEQVIGLNEFMVSKMFEVFGKKNGDEEDDNPNNDYLVPIIPTFGNNDILPHNVMTKGPNSWTRSYSRIWQQFIPEVQRHQFEQGGWFSVEVIPHKLAVFSLNTLYFFSSNAAADGCAARSEPGYRQMEWLRIQLQFMRERGMKAILTGHVPPVRQDAKTNWDETCWQKYTLWMHQYRDVVISGMYGHFNYDHFMLQDFKDVDKDTKNGKMGNYGVNKASIDGDDGEMHAALSSSYFTQLRDQWAKLPQKPKFMKSFNDDDDDSDDDDESWFSILKKKSKKDKKKHKRKNAQKKYLQQIGGPHAERFSASFVAASIVPNLFPAFRVFEYNTTGLDVQHPQMTDISGLPGVEMPCFREESKKGKKKKKKGKERKYKFVVPEGPSRAEVPGPAYSPQTLSLLKFTQYFANLTRINNDFTKDKALDAGDGGVGEEGWKGGKHKWKKPHDRDHDPNPKKFEFEVHYDTHDDDVYKLKDLTVPSLLDLAQRIGQFTPEKDALAVDEGPQTASSIDEEVDVDVIGEVEEADEEGNDAGVQKKKKKHHKGKKGKGKKGKKEHKHDEENKPWYAFVRRAYIETMSPQEIEEEFGQ